MKMSGLDENLDSRKTGTRSIPGSYGIPLIGDLFELIYNLPEFVERSHRKYGPIFQVRAGLVKLVFVLGAELTEDILTDKGRRYSAETGYRRLLPLFGRGLLQRDFEDHLFHRRMFQAAFRPDALRAYVPMLAKIMGPEVRQWANIKNFRAYPNIKTLLFQSALATFFGIDHRDQAADSILEKAFFDTLNGTLRIFDANIPGFRMHKATKGRRILREHIAGLIPERRTAGGDDLMSYVCKVQQENGEYFSDEAIIDHMGFMLLAAHDTTASLLQHSIYHLTQYPAWLSRIREEIAGRSIFDLTYEGLQEMKTMGWFIDEVLRVNSPTPAIMRGTLQDVTLNGFTVPAGSNLLLITGFNHHIAEEWPDPDGFDPLRFSREHCPHQRHSFSYIPFGGGVHKCIGIHFARFQAALFISHFVSTFDFDVLPNYKLKLKYLPLTTIRDGLPLALRLRRE